MTTTNESGTYGADIVGIIPPATMVRVTHPGHDLDGKIVLVLWSDHGVGGLGGGGVTKIKYNGETIPVSRYMRVTRLEVD